MTVVNYSENEIDKEKENSDLFSTGSHIYATKRI